MKIEGERQKYIYDSWKTEDLLKAVTIDKAKYEPLAVDIMNKELEKRHVKKEEIAQFEKNFSEKEEILSVSGTPFCPNCHSTNLNKEFELWGFRDYWDKSILGKLLSLFLPKYECLQCGTHFNEGKQTG